MIPGTFDYHRPASLADAIALKSKLGDDAFWVAGGHSLIPMMKLRLAAPDHLIDLQAVDSLREIKVGSDEIVIGAMATQAELNVSDVLATACPIIRETALQIADPQIRNLGTLGGNVANGDPGNDMPALMQALNATYTLTGPDGEREVAAREFYEAAYFTAREDNELLSSVRFARPASGHGSSYMKQKRKVGDYATAAAAVILEMNGSTCSKASIALTNVADTPLHAAEAEAALVGKTVDKASIDAAVAAAMAITDPAEDGRGPADYRRHVAGVMVRRAIQQAAGLS